MYYCNLVYILNIFCFSVGEEFNLPSLLSLSITPELGLYHKLLISLLLFFAAIMGLLGNKEHPG